MHKFALAIVASLSLAGCVSPYLVAKVGKIGGTVVAMWVGADKFVYVPGPEGKNFAFETATTGRVIAPGLMYTDGGSIPRIGQLITGQSSWGFGPAYIIHDWIFYGRHCYVDPAAPEYDDVARFDDVNGRNGSKPITFDESALILAEVIRTLVDHGLVREHTFAAELISSAVDSPIALASWNRKGGCEQYRVRPFDIAVVWLSIVGDENKLPPTTWKLSHSEIVEARKHFAAAKLHIKSLSQDKRQEPARKRRLIGDEIAQN
jgi:hypothetical protein